MAEPELYFVEKVQGMSYFWKYQIYLQGVVEDSVWEKSRSDVLLFSPAQSLFLSGMKIR